MAGKITALVECQNEHCATEISYTLDQVAKLNGLPICQDCYENGDYGEQDWNDLPPVLLEDLSR